LGGHNFLNFISFFIMPNVPIGGVQVLFGDKKQRSPPLGFGLP